jgi:hypothetical protein
MALDKIESIFLSVLEDIKDYLPDLTIVGGWIPYIYSNYLWNNFVNIPVTTADIDFGVDQDIAGNYPKTIFQTLSSLNYKEKHLQMDKLFPVVLYKDKIPIEFITYPDVDITKIDNFVGRQIQINKIDKFDFLLKNRIQIDIKAKQTNKLYRVNCPKPSAFLYHKTVIFTDRLNNKKQAKDLYYMYFILRYAPNIDAIIEEISQYRTESHFKYFHENLSQYFGRISSPGCLLVEQENGPDPYILDVRKDIFDRFKNLQDKIKHA